MKDIIPRKALSEESRLIVLKSYELKNPEIKITNWPFSHVQPNNVPI